MVEGVSVLADARGVLESDARSLQIWRVEKKAALSIAIFRDYAAI